MLLWRNVWLHAIWLVVQKWDFDEVPVDINAFNVSQQFSWDLKYIKIEDDVTGMHHFHD